MTDVLLRLENDGGEIQYVNGQAVMSDGLETAVTLSLFGGNEDDDGSEATKSKQWWGNLSERTESRMYRSETQALLRALPATAANLRRLEDAANRDLAWMLDEVADALSVQASIPKLNAVTIEVSIEIDGKRFPFTFGKPWQLVR